MAIDFKGYMNAWKQAKPKTLDEARKRIQDYGVGMPSQSQYPASLGAKLQPQQPKPYALANSWLNAAPRPNFTTSAPRYDFSGVSGLNDRQKAFIDAAQNMGAARMQYVRQSQQNNFAKDMYKTAGELFKNEQTGEYNAAKAQQDNQRALQVAQMNGQARVYAADQTAQARINAANIAANAVRQNAEAKRQADLTDPTNSGFVGRNEHGEIYLNTIPNYNKLSSEQQQQARDYFTRTGTPPTSIDPTGETTPPSFFGLFGGNPIYNVRYDQNAIPAIPAQVQQRQGQAQTQGQTAPQDREVNFNPRLDSEFYAALKEFTDAGVNTSDADYWRFLNETQPETFKALMRNPLWNAYITRVLNGNA
jgi:hypothetical protein